MKAEAFIDEHFSPTEDGRPLFIRALTHGSRSEASYERLEFLGDRVLGLVVAHWLYERFPKEPEGKMSRRYNALVARETCAEVGRQINVVPHILLGRQAREDNTQLSDNVVGDVMEALLGALFIDRGIDPARDFIRQHWEPFLGGQVKVPVHPKSALQELAAAKNMGVPHYEILGRVGPHHAPRFKVKVVLGRHGEAEAEGASKQEAETAAAKALLEKFS